MCGGHGLHHLINLAAASTHPEGEPQPIQGDNAPVNLDLDNEVKLMYARGEIGTEAFRRLHAMAQAKELAALDIDAFRLRGAGNSGQPENVRSRANESRSNHSHEHQQQRADLEAACLETEESVHRLQLEAATLYQEAEIVDISLDTKAHIVSQAEAVEQRITLIRERFFQLKALLADVVAQQRLFES